VGRAFSFAGEEIMTTELRNTVTRRCTQSHDHRHKHLVVTLEPGDVIGFREERSRKKFTAPLARVFKQVLVWNLEAMRATKKKGKRRCSLTS
jgi:hypothetical protein